MTSKSRRVLLVAHDRGGVNQLVPLLRHWHRDGSGITAEFLSTPMIEWEVAAMCGAQLKSWPQPTKVDAADEVYIGRSAWTFSKDQLRSVLERGWDLVLTGTSMLSRLETSVWRLCNDMSVPCAAICDMWSEYRRRLTDDAGQVPLGILLVVDERMEAEARSELGADPPVKVVGSPHFNSLIMQGGCVQQDGGSIRFVSEPVAALFPQTGIHEFHVAQELIAARNRLGLTTPIMLRPHPQDDVEAWRRFVHDHRDGNVNLDVEPSWVCTSTTKMALGMSSMMLIELAMSGVPVASYQPPSADKSFYCLEEDEFGIQVLRSLSDFDQWLAAPRLPRVSASFLRRHTSAIERITDLVRNGELFA